MCNLPLGGGRRPYGHDALTAGPVHEYEVGPDYSPSPEQDAALPFYENQERECLHSMLPFHQHSNETQDCFF